MSNDVDPVEAWVAAVAASHRRLAEAVAPLSGEDVAGPSYASQWSIAQVLSHLGSGAEIFGLILAAGSDGRPAPGMDEFRPIWARWDAKAPGVQAVDGLAADAAFVAEIEALDASRRASWRLELFGAEQDLSGLLRLRLGEHAVHTWDVAVATDAGQTVAPEAVDLLIDTLDGMVGRVGKPAAAAVAVEVVTSQPPRRFLLLAGEEAPQLSGLQGAGGAEVQGVVHLPAEALIRLVYGRLDPQHTPAVALDGVDLDVLRGIFPGF